MNRPLFLSLTSFRRSALAVIFSLTASLIVPFAQAADDAPSSSDIKRAADSFDQGRERFRDGDYTEAAEMFEAADDFAPSAAALRLAMAARKEAGQLARAATLAALALERHQDDQDLKSEAETVLSEVSSDLAKLSISCDVECELTLNNRLVHGRAAQSRTIYVEPGKLTMRASWSEGRTQSERLKVRAGDSRDVSFYAPAIEEAPTDVGEQPAYQEPVEETPAPVEEPESSGWSPAVFWTGTALTLGGVGASAALGVRAINNPGKEAVTEGCEAGDDNCDLYLKGRRNQTATNVAIGITSAVGVFTIITGIWLTDWGGGKKSDSASNSTVDPKQRFKIRPVVSIGLGAYIGANGTF